MESKSAPLLLDRTGCRIIASSAPLLLLPIEVLSLIIAHVRRADLSSLSLVNTDCWQLARTRRFAQWTVDFSPWVTRSLRAERGKLADQSLKDAGRGSIAGCVRSLTISKPSKEDGGRRKACLDDIEHLLNVNAFSNIRISVWDGFVLAESLLHQSMRTSIEHLKLRDFVVAQDYELNMLEECSNWRLRSLHLNARCHDPSMRLEKGVAHLYSSILRSCARTLESLVLNVDYQLIKFNPGNIWRQWLEGSTCLIRDPLRRKYPHFPRLQSLVLRNIVCKDVSFYEAFFGPGSRLVEVELDFQRYPRTGGMASFFNISRNMPYLRTLRLYADDDDVDHSPRTSALLKSNPQISSVAVLGGCRDQWLSLRLLPSMQTFLPDLKTLSLTRYRPSNERTADYEAQVCHGPDLAMYQQISLFHNLEHLFVTIRIDGPTLKGNVIDMQVRAIEPFQKLTNLRTLVFHNDICVKEATSTDPQLFYTSNSLFPVDDSERELATRASSCTEDDRMAAQEHFNLTFRSLSEYRQYRRFELLLEHRSRDIAVEFANGMPWLEIIRIGRITWDLKSQDGPRRVTEGHLKAEDSVLMKLFGLQHQHVF